jgi:hypothetical protein
MAGFRSDALFSDLFRDLAVAGRALAASSTGPVSASRAESVE